MASPIAASPDPYPAPVALTLEWVDLPDADNPEVWLSARWDADWNGTITLEPSDGVTLGRTAWTMAGRAGDRHVLTMAAEVPENKFWEVWAKYESRSRANSARLVGWGGPPVLTDRDGYHLIGQLGDPGLRAEVWLRGNYTTGGAEGVILDADVEASAPWTEVCRKGLLDTRFKAPKGEVTRTRLTLALNCPLYFWRYYVFDLVIDRTGDQDRVDHGPLGTLFEPTDATRPKQPGDGPSTVSKAPSSVAPIPLLLALLAWRHRKPR